MAKESGSPIEPAVHIKWATDVADHDYVAAEAYLSLKLGEDAVAKAVQRLRKGALTIRPRTTSSEPRGWRRHRSTTPAS